MTAQGVGVFSSVTFNLAQWVESMASPSILYGYVAYDGYIYRVSSGNPFSPVGPTFSTLTPGKGYNYYHSANYQYTLNGQLNTSTLSVALANTDPDLPDQYGLNLLGNPFISGLNWDDITNGVYATYPDSTSKVLHYTRDNVQVYYVNGVGSEAGVTGIIPPMQGFFTKTYKRSATGRSITLHRSARVHDAIPQRYKGSAAIPLVRIKLSDGTGYDNTVVRFDEKADAGFDYDFDATKTFISETGPSVYSEMSGVKYAINGMPFPVTSTEIPLTLKMSSAGSHAIEATEILELDNYSVWLKDLELNITTDLKQTSIYNFSAPTGLLSNRFVLLVSDLATGTEEIAVNELPFNIYSYSGNINIVPLNDVWDGVTATIAIIDIAGKRISTSPGVELRNGYITTIQAPTSNGIYFVEIRSGQRKHAGKIIIK
jgi:hypothetical protein